MGEQNLDEAARVVRLQVVDHDVVHLGQVAAQGVGHVAEEGVLVLVLHGVEKGDLRVLDEKGVVRGAERRAGVAVEISRGPVHCADPSNVVGDVAGSHMSSQAWIRRTLPARFF